MKIFRVYLPVQRKEETFYRTPVSLWGQEYGSAIILHTLVNVLEKLPVLAEIGSSINLFKIFL